MVKGRRPQLRRLWEAQGGLCFYCECDTHMPLTNVYPPWSATREHLQRKVDGGGHTDKNLVMACKWCNASRNDTHPVQHRENMLFLAQVIGRHPCWPQQHNEHVIRMYKVWYDDEGEHQGTDAEAFDEYRIAHGLGGHVSLDSETEPDCAAEPHAAERETEAGVLLG